MTFVPILLVEFDVENETGDWRLPALYLELSAIGYQASVNSIQLLLSAGCLYLISENEILAKCA
jgi:hypothetical protein